jgi:hypothetical protein
MQYSIKKSVFVLAIVFVYSCTVGSLNENIVELNSKLNCDVLTMYDEPCSFVIEKHHQTPDFFRYIVISPLDTSNIINIKKSTVGAFLQIKSIPSKKFEQGEGKKFPYTSYKVFTEAIDSTLFVKLGDYVQALNIAPNKQLNSNCANLMHPTMCYIDAYYHEKLVSCEFLLVCNKEVHNFILSMLPENSKNRVFVK